MQMLTPELKRAAVTINQHLTNGNHHFYIIGGLAMQRWGEPRMTSDIDVTVMAPFGQEAKVTEQLLQFLQPRIQNVRDFAMSNRVILLQDENGIPVDVSLGGLFFEKKADERASKWQLASYGSVRTCSAEDLLVFKFLAGRDQDWIDIDGILTRQGQKLDLSIIQESVRELAYALEDAAAFDRLRQIFKSHDLVLDDLS